MIAQGCGDTMTRIYLALDRKLAHFIYLSFYTEGRTHLSTAEHTSTKPRCSVHSALPVWLCSTVAFKLAQDGDLSVEHNSFAVSVFSNVHWGALHPMLYNFQKGGI